MFLQVRYWLEDPTTRKKILLIFGSVIVIGLIIYVIFSLNQAENRRRNPQRQTPHQTTIVTPATFDSSSELVKVSETQTALPLRVYFNPENDDIYYVDENYHVIKNQTRILETEEYLPRTVNFLSNSIIAINEDFETTLFYGETSRNTKLDQNVRSLVQTEGGDIWFVDQNENELLINRSFGVSRLSFFEQRVALDINGYQIYDLKTSGDKVFLFAYQYPNRTGNTKLFEINENEAKEILSIENLQSMIFSKDKVLYSTDIYSSQPKNFVVDLQNNPGSPKEISTVQEKLKENNISGNVVAQRCGFTQNQNGLVCLVKESFVNFNEASSKDVIAEIDISTLNVEFTKRDLVFSGAAIHVSPKDELYIVGQEQKFIYKLQE